MMFSRSSGILRTAANKRAKGSAIVLDKIEVGPSIQYLFSLGACRAVRRRGLVVIDAHVAASR